MLLAEAMMEKDFIKESIESLEQDIEKSMIVQDKSEFKTNKILLEGKLDNLHELYTRYRQFSVMVERAKAKASIKIKDGSLSLADALAIRDLMVFKLSVYKKILSTAYKFKDNLICMDIDDLFKQVEEIKLDIKTLNSSIEHTCWNVEVS